MSIFDKRAAFKPFEYPEVTGYKDAINHSYWLVSEWNFVGDIHDFRANMTLPQQNVIKNALLAIAQIEVSVKRFWGKLGDRLPKAEIEQVGATFAESEVRHADAYSHLLQVLDLNRDFAALLEVPAIKARVAYLNKSLKLSTTAHDCQFTHVLALFSLFVENVSLFSQFAIIKSFNKHLNVLKDIDNVVQATQKEELIHALFGVHLVNLIRKENPSWWDTTVEMALQCSALEAFEAESQIIDWIFEAGDLSFLTAATVKEFVKNRINESLAMIDVGPVFPTVEMALLEPLRWFDEEMHADISTDFFHKRPVTYSKMTKSITSGDLF